MTDLKQKEEYLSALLLKQQHKKQREATAAPEQIRALFWGNRVGKSHWGAQEVVRYVFANHEHRKIDLPIEIWCACPSFDQQLETTQRKLQELIPKHRIKDVSYVKKNTWGSITLDNGSRITFKSYEQGREKFQGVGKRLIWFDEEPPKDIWEEAFVRVEAGVPLDIILTMTAIKGMTWIYSDLYLATENPNIFVSTAGWKDNPWLTKEQIDKMSEGLSEDVLKVRRDGKFVRRVGLVCNWWDRDVHLKPNIIRQSGWNLYRVIDFGWSSSKTCVLWIGVDTHDNVHIFDGLYLNHTDDEELAKLIKQREENFRVLQAWADNQPDRIDTLRRNGVYCEPVDKSVGGSNYDETRTEAMAKVGRVDKVTGKSRLSVSKTLTHFDTRRGAEVNWFVQEIESLKWGEKKQDGQELRKWDKEGGDRDSHFDAMDTFSYFCIMFGRKGSEYKEKRKKNRSRRKVINPITGY